MNWLIIGIIIWLIIGIASFCIGTKHAGYTFKEVWHEDWSVFLIGTLLGGVTLILLILAVVKEEE